MLKLIATVPWRVAVRKRVPVAGKDNLHAADARGFTTEPDGFQLADIEIWVDPDALARARGWIAIRSKKHVSKLQNGGVIVKALNVRKES